MQSWFALTDGRLRDVTTFARAGQGLGNDDSASVQLVLQEAKGWAKLGQRRQAEDALERGHSLLDRLPRAYQPGHHFVFDPSKYPFYAAPIYEWLGDHARAEEHCQEVFAQCMRADGTTPWPMRLAARRRAQNACALVPARQTTRSPTCGASIPVVRAMSANSPAGCSHVSFTRAS